MSLPLPSQVCELSYAELATQHPPRWRDVRKEAVYELVRKKATTPSGQLRFTRWNLMPLPEALDLSPCEITPTLGAFNYDETGPSVWHMNFADPRLFAAYGSALMAQDEWQVLEHPLLGSLREYLLQAELPALTRADGVGTPVLISAVPRECELDVSQSHASTTPRLSIWKRWTSSLSGSSPKNGPPLYGNAFQKASVEEVLNALRIPPHSRLSNILAISAPTGSGAYQYSQIEDILLNAYTGFKAAILESERLGALQRDVQIHTGWWGCGAFGGNRTLMAMLQLLAAQMSGISRLHFHIMDEPSQFDLDEAIAFLDSILSTKPQRLSQVITAIHDLGFRWGTSDGN